MGGKGRAHLEANSFESRSGNVALVRAVAAVSERARMCNLSPQMTPRASWRQYGANRPENAGTKYTPLVSLTCLACVSGREMMQSLAIATTPNTYQSLGVSRRGDDAQAVPEPRDGRPGDGNRTLMLSEER
jgi:hypothetical protein